MGASREGYNLATKYGRRAFWRDLTKYRFFNHYVWRDTFGPLACLVIGHKPYDSDGDKACKRCCQYL